MFDRCELWQNHVAPGAYPDCDMLPLGKLGGGFGHGERDTCFTWEEQITMMTLWCVFGSLLMVGGGADEAGRPDTLTAHQERDIETGFQRICGKAV